MSFGTEIVFFVALGVVVLGPKRLQALIGHVIRAKHRFEEVAQGFKSKLAEELDGQHSEEPKRSL